MHQKINEEDLVTWWTLEAMRRFGGGFVKMIGNLGAHADKFNIERMKIAWPEYWAEYMKMGESLRSRKEMAENC
ncbi:MAG: hypothetical protein WC730_04170 [Patescibacteria group bacterium]|jgi:hypothetical protein